jgi:hypothetical protein
MLKQKGFYTYTNFLLENLNFLRIICQVDQIRELMDTDFESRGVITDIDSAMARTEYTMIIHGAVPSTVTGSDSTGSKLFVDRSPGRCGSGRWAAVQRAAGGMRTVRGRWDGMATAAPSCTLPSYR